MIATSKGLNAFSPSPPSAPSPVSSETIATPMELEASSPSSTPMKLDTTPLPVPSSHSTSAPPALQPVAPPPTSFAVKVESAPPSAPPIDASAGKFDNPFDEDIVLLDAESSIDLDDAIVVDEDLNGENQVEGVRHWLAGLTIADAPALDDSAIICD